MASEENTTSEINPNEEFIKNAKEYRGWDLASESYRIGEQTWKIQKDCRKPAKEAKIRELSDKIEDLRQQVESNKIKATLAVNTVNTINKEILEMTLIGFNYEQAVEEYGHKALGQVSRVMQGIFLMFGGWEEMIYMIKQGMAESMLLSKLAKDTING